VAEDGQAAMALLEHQHVDIMLADLEMPGLGGVELLARVKRISPHTEVVIMTGSASVSSAVEAMRLGANDYLPKPFHPEEIKLLLERVVRARDIVEKNRLLRDQVRQGISGYGHLLGSHSSMVRLFRQIIKVNHGSYPVIIQGESGTGKELVARSIHDSGPLAGRPFLPVDCGALVATLIESELFGHVRGAFTGASQSKRGLLEAAQGGTVFLDEIGELPLDMQVKLLRALQEKEIRPVGSNLRVKIDARVIVATSQNLEAAAAQGSFRQDLYYRLNVVTLRLPPLRERRSDIPLLAHHFLDKFTPPGRHRLTISEEAMQKLMDYGWPGNVRELENCIEATVALDSDPNLQGADHRQWDVQAKINRGLLPVAVGDDALSGNLPVAASDADTLPLAEMERRAIYRAIASTGGDKLMAARLLGIGKTTLYRKLNEYKALSGMPQKKDGPCRDAGEHVAVARTNGNGSKALPRLHFPLGPERP
jgi:two-component system response regulator HydG